MSQTLASEGKYPTRILCIDDSPDTADSEAMFLSLLGFDARSCYGGIEAMALVESFRPAICLIDVDMPGMNGHELATKLRERSGGQSLLLIAVTGRTTDVNEAWITPFDVLLLKPVETGKLLAALGTPLPKHTSSLLKSAGWAPSQRWITDQSF